MPNLAHGLDAKDIKAKIAALISNLVDITDAETKLMHGTMPYAELEDMQPGEMPLELFEKNTVFTPGSRKER